jgi:hypothetical protein
MCSGGAATFNYPPPVPPRGCWMMGGGDPCVTNSPCHAALSNPPVVPQMLWGLSYNCNSRKREMVNVQLGNL